MSITIGDSELKVMEALWEEQGAYAIDIANRMTKEQGWKKNTTYTLLSRLIDKGAIERQEPKFFCKPLISKEDVVRKEASSIIDRICGGSQKLFLTAFLGNNKELTEADIQDIKRIVDKLK